MKKIIIFGIVVCLLLILAVPVSADKPVDKNKGFNEYGYNYEARIFVGIGENWFRGKYGLPVWEEGMGYAWDPTYGPDHLVLKWSKAWDDANFGPDGIRYNGDELPWTPRAWCTNEWNGMFPGGSQEIWHYTNIWVGPELENSPYWREGGYAIWGQFEVIMSHGIIDGEHVWDRKARPCGRGGVPPGP